MVDMLGAVDCLAGAQAVGIVGVADAVGAVGSGGKLTAPGPGEAPGSAVIIAGGIANSVVGDGLAVNSGEQVGPTT